MMGIQVPAWAHAPSHVSKILTALLTISLLNRAVGIIVVNQSQMLMKNMSKILNIHYTHTVVGLVPCIRKVAGLNPTLATT